MAAFYAWLGLNWLYLIGAIISFIAALGFLIFLRGFLLGLNQLIYIDSHAEYVDRAQVRSVWGVLIILNAFEAWVLIRAIVAMFGGAPVNVNLTIWILAVYALVVAALWLRKK